MVLQFFKNRSFKKDLEKALDDGVLTDAEVQHLQEKSNELGVPQQFVNQVLQKHFHNRIAPIRAEIEASHRFSPYQEEELKAISKALRIQVNIDPALKIFRQLWLAENGQPMELTPLSTSVLLGKGEICYHAVAATWKQIKTVREHVGSSGHSMSLRIAKGWSYRVSTLKPVYNERDTLAEISEGQLLVTNKRLVFNGSRKSTNITFRRLLGLNLYTDGVGVQKSSGNPDIFILAPPHAEYVAVMVHQLVQAA